MALPGALSQELARQSAAGDDWFTSNLPYALELRGPARVVPGGSVVFVLPLGPEQLVVETLMRQSVSPTIGGIVAEERGILWREITIDGTFGLFPKKTRDTTTPAVGADLLSGPGWFKRLEQNVIGRYAELKADPDVSADVKLVWHDTRKDDHWIVVPETLGSHRSVARRIQYPYTLRLRAVEDTSDVEIPPTEAEKTLFDLRLRNLKFIKELKAGIATVQAAIDYGSLVQQQVRFWVADIAEVTGTLVGVVDAAASFVDNLTPTISSPRQFFAQAAAVLDDVLSIMEDATELPGAVRQNYQSALDGVHQVAAQIALFVEDHEARLDTARTAEQGAARASTERLQAAEDEGPPRSLDQMASQGIRSVDKALIVDGAVPGSRAARAYTGIREYTVLATDTLESIAAVLLGDAAYWYDIAVINGLTPPYLSPTGAPGTIGPGGTLAVPVFASAANPLVPASASAESALDDLLGTGVQLAEAPGSRPGRPLVDWAIDRRTSADVKLIIGLDNLAQALQMRLWTELGSMPSAPRYGLRRLVGFGVNAADITALRIAVRETVLADRRVENVQRFQFTADQDLVDIDMDVVPIGASSSRTVRSSLT